MNVPAGWTDGDLNRIGNAEELEISSIREDGTLRPFVIIWVVRAGNGLYVRSAYGATNPWFVRALKSGLGQIRAGGIERDVTFAAAADGVRELIDAAYHAKYDRYGPKIINTVVGPQAHATTLQLLPC